MKRSFTDYLAFLLLGLIALIGLFPLYWMFVTAFKPGTSVITMPPDLSWTHFTTANFDKLLAIRHLWNWTANSFIIALCGIAGNVLFCAMAGYAFAKKQFPGKTLLFWIIISIMMTSTQVVMIPLFMLVRDMDLLNTFGGLILPVLVSPFAVFLAKQFISTIPNDLIEAAKMDGSSELGIFMRVIIPLSLPVLAIVTIFTFVTHWNDFLWPLLATDTATMRTLQVGIATLKLQNSTDYGLLLAGAVWTSAPILVIFLCFQRFFVKGITIGAVKG